MIRIALCDDEKKILEELFGYIKTYAKSENNLNIEVFCFDSARTLMGVLEDGKSFDIFVLDVYIGDEMGTTLASNIRKMGIENPIIFATTSLEHAPESYETGTLRYLIKPINPTKFYEALSVALAQVEKMGERFVKFKTENGVESVQVNHIMHSESRAHYQYITLKDDSQIRVRNTVSEMFATLQKYGGFIRVGSSYIINLQYVKNISRTEVLLYNDIYIPIPRGKYSEIKNAFWDFQYEGQED